MTTKQSLARIAHESARAASARRALASRAQPLSRLASRVHPLVLVGSALAGGLLAGRLAGRPGLPHKLQPTSIVVSALEKSLVAWLESLFTATLTRAAASDGSTAESPPGTQSRSR